MDHRIILLTRSKLFWKKNKKTNRLIPVQVVSLHQHGTHTTGVHIEFKHGGARTGAAEVRLDLLKCSLAS